MLRRYCPPTSNRASLIWPSEQQRTASIRQANTFIIMIPNEKAAIEATTRARLLNPTIKIITRCHYTSAGIVAKAHGADEVVVAEVAVAAEASKLVTTIMGPAPSGK